MQPDQPEPHLPCIGDHPINLLHHPTVFVHSNLPEMPVGWSAYPCCPAPLISVSVIGDSRDRSLVERLEAFKVIAQFLVDLHGSWRSPCRHTLEPFPSRHHPCQCPH